MESNRLEERVVCLERRLRINRRIQAAAGLGVLLYVTSSLSAPTQDSARQGRFELVDSEGRTRIVLEADPKPRLAMLSASGQEQVRLGIGGEGPFNSQETPNLSLITGSTQIQVFVSPAPTSEGLEDRHRVESAVLMMSSSRVVDGEIQQKILNTLLQPNKAVLSLMTYDPKDPATSIYDPGVKLFVNEAGEVTTKLGNEKSQLSPR